jgi:hypothetical protein
MIRLSGGLVAVGAVVALGLTGCGPAQTVSAPPPAGAGASAGTDTAVASPTPPMVAQIGGTVTYPEGVAVTVVSAVRYRMGEGARIGREAKQGIRVAVKITNGSKVPLDLALVTGNLHSGANGAEAEVVFDSESNVGGFSGTIAPGRSASANLGFAVLPADLGRVSLDVNVGFRDAALFEGTVR